MLTRRFWYLCRPDSQKFGAPCQNDVMLLSWMEIEKWRGWKSIGYELTPFGARIHDLRRYST